MNAPTAKIPPKRMGLGISPEIQKTIDAVKEVAAATNIPTHHFPSSSPVVQQPATEATTTPPSNVQQFQPVTPHQERKARGPKPAPVRRYSVDLPVYLIDEITEKAYRKKCKKRTLFLNAFKDAGFTVKDIDLRESKADE